MSGCIGERCHSEDNRNKNRTESKLYSKGLPCLEQTEWTQKGFEHRPQPLNKHPGVLLRTIHQDRPKASSLFELSNFVSRPDLRGERDDLEGPASRLPLRKRVDPVESPKHSLRRSFIDGAGGEGLRRWPQRPGYPDHDMMSELSMIE